jgi:hypothetical protein
MGKTPADKARIDPDNLDHLFTPEVIAHLDRISAAVKAGARTYSLEEADEYIRTAREDWLANHRR